MTIRLAVVCVLGVVGFAAPAKGQSVARHGLTPAQYQSTFNDLVGQGYRLVTVSGYVTGNTERYAALWEKKAGPAWEARHGLTAAQYQQTFDQLAAQGYRLKYVSGHAFGGQDRYAAVWVKEGGPGWAARHGLTGAQYQQVFDELTKQGYRLVHVSGHGAGSVARYAAIFEKSSGPAWVARHGLSAAAYQQAFNEFTGQGYRLKVVSGYEVGGADHYAAIWEKSGSLPWAARHGIPDSWYQNVFDNYTYQGYRPVFITAFGSGASGKLNGVWENANIKAADLQVIAMAIKTYMDANAPPGVAFAITKDGRLVYAAASGYTSDAKTEEVGPLNLFRVASVSKPLTAVAVMRLVETNRLGLDDRVFGPGGILSAQFPTPAGNTRINQITVRHLLQHLSGLSNTPNDPMFQNTGLDHAALISWVLNDPARVVTRNSGAMYEYLNFGYCLLGRIIEQRSGQTYEAYVRDNVLAPSGVSAMVVGGNTVAERRPREVMYTPAGAYSLNVRRFDSHGGWVSSPVDLVRFLVRVDGNASKPDIITAASRTAMIMPANVNDVNGNNPNYGFGWAANPQSHNGAMAGTTAVLALRPNGFGYAAVANMRPGGDQFAGQLAKMVQDIIAGVSAWPGYDLF
ncbi:MAG TPA: serine hydrolase [Vicinamibacterales bacterium]|nr:serine hydrolase [Vicinamibacterales bacterium]